MMKRTWMRMVAAVAAAGLLANGCATVATHYQVRAAMEKEARLNLARGRGPLCAVEGQAVPISDVTFWAMVRDNWPDYAKAIGLDFGTCLVAYIIYERSRGHDTTEYQSYYYDLRGTDEAADAGGE